jgi:hypothetical protein
VTTRSFAKDDLDLEYLARVTLSDFLYSLFVRKMSYTDVRKMQHIAYYGDIELKDVPKQLVSFYNYYLSENSIVQPAWFREELPTLIINPTMYNINENMCWQDIVKECLYKVEPKNLTLNKRSGLDEVMQLISREYSKHAIDAELPNLRYTKYLECSTHEYIKALNDFMDNMYYCVHATGTSNGRAVLKYLQKVLLREMQPKVDDEIKRLRESAVCSVRTSSASSFLIDFFSQP